MKKIIKNNLDNETFLNKPNKDIKYYLNNLENVSNLDNDVLEEYLSVFTAWQNYYHEFLLKYDVERLKAQQTMEYAYSLAIQMSEGTVNLRKDLAKSDKRYRKSVEIYYKMSKIYEEYKFKYESCERAFRLISRILTKRFNLKYDF